MLRYLVSPERALVLVMIVVTYNNQNHVALKWILVVLAPLGGVCPGFMNGMAYIG